MRRIKTKLLSPKDVAELLEFEPRTVSKWCRDGKFPTAHKVGRVWRISYEDLVLRRMLYGRD